MLSSLRKNKVFICKLLFGKKIFSINQYKLKLFRFLEVEANKLNLEVKGIIIL